MSIGRISEFQAQPEQSENLREFLISILPLIKSSEGCQSVQLYQNQENPARFTVIEVWDRVESHQASVKNIPSEKLAEIRPMLGAAPGGSYHDLVSDIRT